MEHDPMTREAFEKARWALASEIAEIAGEGSVLPGTVLVRMMGCGKAGCRCKADPPRLHGPYIQWTRKVAGKTLTQRLTEEELARYRSWFDNARRLRELIGRLESLCLHAASTAEGWQLAE